MKKLPKKPLIEAVSWSDPCPLVQWKEQNDPQDNKGDMDRLIAQHGIQIPLSRTEINGR